MASVSEDVHSSSRTEKTPGNLSLYERRTAAVGGKTFGKYSWSTDLTGCRKSLAIFP